MQAVNVTAGIILIALSLIGALRPPRRLGVFSPLGGPLRFHQSEIPVVRQLEPVLPGWYVPAFVLILVLATILRVAKLGDTPFVSFEEMKAAVDCQFLIHTGKSALGESISFFLHPEIYFTIPFVYIFGPTVLAVRLPVVILSMITLVFCFLTLWRLWNRDIALIGLALTTISPWHILLSRQWDANAFFISFFAIMACCLAWGRKKRWVFAISGVFAWLAMIVCPLDPTWIWTHDFGEAQLDSNIRAFVDVAFLQRNDDSGLSPTDFGSLYRFSFIPLIMGILVLFFHKKTPARTLVSLWAIITLAYGILASDVNVKLMGPAYFLFLLLTALGIYTTCPHRITSQSILFTLYAATAVMFLMKYPQNEYLSTSSERSYALVATLAQESEASTIYVSSSFHSEDDNRIQYLFLNGEKEFSRYRFQSFDSLPEPSEPTVYVFEDSEAELFPPERYSVSLYGSVGIAYSK
jgi:hypothetical protein